MGNMAKKNSIALLFLCVFLLTLLASGKRPLAPALYVFGDSFSDSGNNNFLQNRGRVNYTPYGIDFPLGPTGRYSNGRTFVDFITQLLGLPFAPPYLGLSEDERSTLKTGVNYASGAAGILPETSRALGDILSLDEQINYFQTTVTTDLPKIFRTPNKILKHLSRSIFFVEIGANDYLNNYVIPEVYNSSQLYTPQQFANLLTDTLKTRLMRLYYMGARKFVVLNIIRIGCLPGIVNAVSPRPTTPCAENLNNLASQFNTMLPNVITTLERTLTGSAFVRGDFYSMNLTSTETGFAAAPTPCCELAPTGLCLLESTPCSNRSEYIFWDAFHTTDVAISGIATDCFSGSVSCVPINVQQLAKKH